MAIKVEIPWRKSVKNFAGTKVLGECLVCGEYGYRPDSCPQGFPHGHGRRDLRERVLLSTRRVVPSANC